MINITKLNSLLDPLDIALHNCFTGIVGDGSSIRFWIDRWIGKEPLSNTFPYLYRIERNKGCLLIERCTGQGRFSQWEWNWLTPPSTSTELFQLQEMLTLIRNTTLSSTKDSWTWNRDTSGIFTVKSMKACLDTAVYRPKLWPFPWNRLAPLKINIFGWRLEMNRLPTSDLLLQRNVPLTSTNCPLCNATTESSPHLFLKCTFSDSLWKFILSWCKLPLKKPQNVRELFELHTNPAISPNKSSLINIIILSYCWTIWKI